MDTEHSSLRVRRLIDAGGPQARLLKRLLDKTTPGPDGCVIWTGAITANGYGRIRAGGRAEGALYPHRAAYALLVAPIADGLLLDHLCHTASTSCEGGNACLHRRCINPAHLEPVTNRENILRSRFAPTAVNARKTECLHGHPFDEANTDRDRNGSRHCRTCRRAKDARRYGASALPAATDSDTDMDEALRRALAPRTAVGR
ncbi:hypothetical protein [Streptomyces sp. NPDC091649]|uniref:hypothetical protein n=1 Tax=Streptomyces sp. NPDC091649 TaxID=3366004 RepID=UPI003825FCD9